MLGNRNTTANRALIQAPNLIDVKGAKQARSIYLEQSVVFTRSDNRGFVLGAYGEEKDKQNINLSSVTNYLEEYACSFWSSKCEPSTRILAYWCKNYGLWSLKEAGDQTRAYSWSSKQGVDAAENNFIYPINNENGLIPLSVDKLLIHTGH